MHSRHHHPKNLPCLDIDLLGPTSNHEKYDHDQQATTSLLLKKETLVTTLTMEGSMTCVSIKNIKSNNIFLNRVVVNNSMSLSRNINTTTTSAKNNQIKNINHIVIICNNLPKKTYNKKVKITMFNQKQKTLKKRWCIFTKEF